VGVGRLLEILLKGGGVGVGDLVACAAWLLWGGGCFAGGIESL